MDLERWNKLRIRHNTEEKDHLRGTLELFWRNNEPVVIDKYMEAHNDFNKVLIREDTYWRQQAKTHWLRNGDLNTQLFHWAALIRHNFHKIKMLTEDGIEEIRDPEGLCGITKHYFDIFFEVRTRS